MSDARPSLHRPHALIVSDDPDLSSFLGEGLVYGGLWTSVIASGLQVLEVFRLRTFDLMLLDVALGGMGAAELVRRLRGDREGTARTDIPILLIADAPGAVDHDAAAQLAIDAVLDPPLDLETLVPDLFRVVAAWRAAHPDRPWADQLAQITRRQESSPPLPERERRAGG